MNFGRYDLELNYIIGTKKRDDGDGYDALLIGGHSVHFNQEEKDAYDKAVQVHHATMYCLGIARTMGLRT